MSNPIIAALAGPLAAMAAFQQFVIYELRPKKGDPAKMDKVPVLPVSWGDRSKLLTAEQAIEALLDWTSAHGHGIGFVFTADDPFFFLDMDNYLGDGQWLPLVGQLVGRLPGCAVEVSSSGRGIHVFGTCAKPLSVDHGCKNVPLRMELYTQDRFVALTGLQVTGDCSTFAAAGIESIAAEFFPVKAASVCDWAGGGPRPDWDGPTDDDDLIRIARNSGQAKAAFGGGVTFNHLWVADAERLGSCWPANDADGDFDRSSADLSLASHLAFWTGCDAPRMERLMKRSGLVREKYQRADYMRNTIEKAISGCHDVFGTKKPPVGPVEWTDAPMSQFPERREPSRVAVDMLSAGGYFHQAASDQRVDRMLWVAARIYPGECSKILEMVTSVGFADTPELRHMVEEANAANIPPIPVELSTGEPLSKLPMKIEENPKFGAAEQASIFEGCVLIPSLNSALLPDGQLLGPDGFSAYMPQGIYSINENKVVDKPWQAFVSSQFLRWPRAQGLTFRPDLEPMSLVDDEGRELVNRFLPHKPDAREGDVSLLLQHIVKLIPDERDRDILLSWMAAIAQYPGRKFRWAPVLQGCEGNGKSIIAGLLQYVVGRRYTHSAQASDLANKFNGWLAGNLLIIINEANFGRDPEVVDAVKPMITDDDVAIQGKGKDQETTRNFANFFLTTNYVGAIGQAVKGRRYSVFMTAQQDRDDLAAQGMTGGYFAKLTTWLNGGGFAHFAHFLANYPINPAFNPATTCLDAPRTSSYSVTVDAAKGSVEQMIEEAIAEGRKGFRSPFVCSVALNELLSQGRKASVVPNRRRREVMQSIGYDWHPSLREGRSTKIISASGGVKPVIFVKKDHPIWQLKNSAEVINKFESTINTNAFADMVGS